MKLLPINTATTIEQQEADNRQWRLREKKNTVARNPSSSLTGLPNIKVDSTFRVDGREIDVIQPWD